MNLDPINEQKRKPSKGEFHNLVFLWKIVKHVKSNAIVVGKNFCVTGIGTGQTNRVGSVKLALNNSKALEKKYSKDKKSLTNCMASVRSRLPLFAVTHVWSKRVRVINGATLLQFQPPWQQ